MSPVRHTFRKSERLCSRTLIDQLFAGGARSCACFPLRAVYKELDVPAGEAAPQGQEAVPQANTHIPVTAQVLMSVSKRRFKHAVDRNRAKRQMREAYRLNRPADLPPMAIAFLWLSDKPVPTPRVTSAMRTLLARIAETKI